MPKLTKQFPTLKVSEKNLEETIKHFLKQKHYSEFTLLEKSLEFTPYYLIEFDAFAEETHEGEKIVSQSFSGKTFLNAVSKQLDETVSDSFHEKLSNEIPEKIPFKVLPEKLSKKNASKIASLLISKQKKLPKENIIISNTEEFFLPHWLVKIKLSNESEYLLKINAVTSEVSGEISAREKSMIELTQETISDLQKPEAWKEYTTSAISDAAKSPQTKSFLQTLSQTLKQNILHNEFVQIAILLLILILLIYLAL